MTARLIKTLIVVILACAAHRALAQVPRPDAIIHGRIIVDGQAATPASNLAIVARIDGIDAPLAAYRLGDLPGLQDRYVLHFAQDFASDGRSASAAAPKAGQTIKLYVQPEGGVEVYAGQTTLPSSGQTLALDVSVSGNDLSTGRDVPSAVGQACGGGGGACGTFGFVNMLTLFAGLGWMKGRGPRHRTSI